MCRERTPGRECASPAVEVKRYGRRDRASRSCSPLAVRRTPRLSPQVPSGLRRDLRCCQKRPCQRQSGRSQRPRPRQSG
eukprot:4841400-Alexandrium_andersonii.AAC.1